MCQACSKIFGCSAWVPLNHTGHRTRGLWTGGADGRRSAVTQIGVESCDIWMVFRPCLKHHSVSAFNKPACHWLGITLARCGLGIGHCVEPRVSSKVSFKLIWKVFRRINQTLMINWFPTNFGGRCKCPVSQSFCCCHAYIMVQTPRKKIHEFWITLCGCLALRS